MKKLLSIILLGLVLTSCGTSDNQPKDGDVKRIVKPIWGINKNISVIRYVDSLYNIGDTIRVDISGLSSINEAVIVR